MSLPMPAYTQRQRNVQQQNTLVAQSLRSCAIYWREHGIPDALRICGEQRGVCWERSMIIHLETDCPGMPDLIGNILTQDERFIRFEMDTTPSVELYEWKDTTASENCNVHNRGIGMGHGALAIMILHEMNGAAPDTK